MFTETRKFSCDWPDCRKSFLHPDNLTSHRRQHTEPKPFRCDVCPLAYWQKSSLRSHRLKAHSGGPTKTQVGSTTPGTVGDDVVSSERLLADSTSAGRIVDGIIRSVTASMQAAGGDKAVSDTTEILGPPGLLDVQDVGHKEPGQSSTDQSAAGMVDHSTGGDLLCACSRLFNIEFRSCYICVASCLFLYLFVTFSAFTVFFLK